MITVYADGAVSYGTRFLGTVAQKPEGTVFCTISGERHVFPRIQLSAPDNAGWSELERQLSNVGVINAPEGAKERKMDITPISEAEARREFGSPITVGEYVAWWVHSDRDASMPATSGSHPTVEAVLAEASIMIDDPQLADDEGRTLRETGFLEIRVVVSDQKG